MSNIVIGIEGLVGAGKTTICRKLIKIIPNTILLNGGNLYRTVIAAVIKKGENIENLVKKAKLLNIKDLMDALKVEIKIENKETCFYVDGKKADEKFIQSKEISMAVSSLGGRTNENSLYSFARNLINKLKENYNVIVSGRDLMKIYPDCDYHIFVIADLDERVKRKAMQYENSDLEEIKKNIVQRDKLQEEAGYYDLSDITKVVDVTDCKTVEESTNKILDVINLKNVTVLAN